MITQQAQRERLAAVEPSSLWQLKTTKSQVAVTKVGGFTVSYTDATGVEHTVADDFWFDKFEPKPL